MMDTLVHPSKYFYPNIEMSPYKYLSQIEDCHFSVQEHLESRLNHGGGEEIAQSASNSERINFDQMKVRGDTRLIWSNANQIFFSQ